MVGLHLHPIPKPFSAPQLAVVGKRETWALILGLPRHSAARTEGRRVRAAAQCPHDGGTVRAHDDARW